MKQFLQFFGSMKTMAVLMLIFAYSIGYATFIENDYGTMTSKAEIYNARWFEILMGLLAINLIYNINKYKMFSVKKIPILTFHVSFLIILLGAAITRFAGFEGSMHIREGSSSNYITSTDAYFKVIAKVDEAKDESSEIIYLSKKSDNYLYSSLNVSGKKVDVELVEYIPDAMDILVEDKDGGSEILELMVTESGSGKPIKLERGSYYENNNIALNFGSSKMFLSETIEIFTEDEKLYMKHSVPLTWLSMNDQTKGEIAPSKKTLLEPRKLFGANGNNFVLRKHYKHARTKIVSNPNASPQQPSMDALKFRVSVDNEAKNVMVFGQSGRMAQESHHLINGVDVHISYGSQKIELPFSIKLLDFQLDRYPGSMSPASYASEVELVDKEENLNLPYRIYMNNILQHRGYRFFQSSYDRDEMGTILSVNNDPGTLPSYIGYFLLGLGMFWSLFSRKNRFEQLSQRAKKASESSKALGLLLSLAIAFSAVPSQASDANSVIQAIVSINEEHAENFGKLTIQDNSGRMKPMDTLTTEILAKIHRGATISVGDKTLDSNQVVLGMMAKPDEFRQLKIIRTKNEKVNRMIGAKADAKYASFAQFFMDVSTLQGYKLAQAVDDAIRKEPKNRDLFDKAVLKIDERVNVSYSVYSGNLMKIWPKPNDPANKWYPTIEALKTFPPKDAEVVRAIVYEYFAALGEATNTSGGKTLLEQTKDSTAKHILGKKEDSWDRANTALKKIAGYQKFYGASVLPSDSRVQAEVFYNKANIFENLFPIYFVLGFILLIFSFLKILKPQFKIDLISNISLYLLIALFLTHTFGLGLRWYIAGHAPWSNGYESMIYISWATVLSGFVFSKRSSMTMASTAILTGLILMVAHLNWMDPQVTNLVPVLNSYWLSIHVAVITASYGFLGLGALLGFITILLFILKNKNNEERLSLSIKELNAINEMSLMIGLAFLTLGNFLGGVWANESWGRYWGWDPKETWALVTILVYAVVIHLRFIKQIYTEFMFSVISLLAYTSVLMTYFGVNYYLAGMHSYAKGDPVPVPDFVPITYTVLFIAIAIAFRNRKLA